MNGQRAYWNGPGAAKTFTTPVPVDLVLARLPLTAPILEYGCGYGRGLAELARAGFTNLTGADSSRALIERGQAEHPDLDLRLVEPGRSLFPDGSFAAALLLAVLTCLPDDQDQADLIAEMGRVLRPGGLLLVNDFLINTDPASQERYARYANELGPYGTFPYGTFRVPDGAVVRHFAPETLRALFAGWEELAWNEAVFTTMNGHQRQGVTLLFNKPY